MKQLARLALGEPPVEALTDEARGGALPPVGRARRIRARTKVGAPVEVWTLDVADEPAAIAALRLGARGVSGFFAGGRSTGGRHAWLLRHDVERTDGSLARAIRSVREPWPVARAIRVGLDVATALAAAEAERAWIGPLTTSGVILVADVGPDGAPGRAQDRAHVVADAWVAELFGGAPVDRSAELAPQYTPPAQADGAPWDAAANRYVLGLVLYRMIAGAHPFGGAGLRHALDEAKHRGAPPFGPEIARSLPPGLQSSILSMLDPDERERPPNARAIQESWSRFADPHRVDPTLVSGQRPLAQAIDPAPVARGREPAPPIRERERVAPPRESPPRARSALPRRVSRSPLSILSVVLPLAVCGAVAAAALTQLRSPPAAASAKEVKVSPAKPLAANQITAKDCEGCHPRQAAEWRRSVMGHSVKSPLFNALEILVEEQVGRDSSCPNGAGVLRKVDERTACRDRATNLAVTGSGGEHWCVNCHSPTENLEGRMPSWEGLANGDPRSRLPARDLLGPQAMEGVSCGFCHTVHGPATPGSAYQGNPTWTSFLTGAKFSARPEDQAGLFGIGNSGYELRPSDFVFARTDDPLASGSLVAHRTTPTKTEGYLASSEFCGSCHDVRLFGTDTIGGRKGEHFKRLRNAYSEWVAWADLRRRRSEPVATCQNCHMSAFPGVCEPGAAPGDPACPDGTGLVPRSPRDYPQGYVAVGSRAASKVTTHYLSGVDLPLSREYPEALVDEDALDAFGVPLSARKRRDMLLRSTFKFTLGRAAIGADARGGRELAVPITIENVGAGHRVPAGFSQEREIWVHLRVTDADGRVVYEVGKVSRASEDLADKVFLRVNTDPQALDFAGRPIGLFGADVRDGPDVPVWSPPPELGGTSFRGRGLVNFQNGFLRCVRCIGIVSPDGSRCDPSPDQLGSRAARFDDGRYDLDTGVCESNLSPEHALFETYFPVGALDASRGLVKAPDAIIDTRSLPPETPITYTYALDATRARAPLTIEAELQFRAFPPYLIRAFAAYEAAQSRAGLRPNGPLVDDAMLERLDVVTVARATATVR